MPSTERERITALLDAKRVSINKLANGDSALQRRLQRQIKEGAKVTKATLDVIITAFPDLNRDWLFYGEGEMLNTAPLEPNASLLGRAVRASGDDTVKVRFFEVSPTASFIEFCSGMSEDPDFVTTIPNHGETIDDTYCVFSIYGDSMEPQIHSHAQILCQEILPTRWHTIHDGIIAIAYADKFVIKRIVKNGLASGNTIILASDNPNYPERQTVQLTDIRVIFRAKRIISQRIE